MNITITNAKVFVNGVAVANVTDFETLRDALLRGLHKRDAVYMTVALLGEARTSEIADFLGLDRANCTKVLEKLEDDGLIEVADDANYALGRGRPSRTWVVRAN